MSNDHQLTRTLDLEVGNIVDLGDDDQWVVVEITRSDVGAFVQLRSWDGEVRPVHITDDLAARRWRVTGHNDADNDLFND